MKKALITGITGQDGSFLAEYLLSKNYEVHGIIRRSSSFNTSRIDKIFNKINLHYGDLTDSLCLQELIKTIMPDEIYNLASQSHVKVSFDIPDYTNQVALGCPRILEIIKQYDKEKKIKFYQASSSEMFGNSPAPQNELTPFSPTSPYAISKVLGFWSTVLYRNSFNLFACNGILFNHESERRGETFVTRKITKGIAKLINGSVDCLYFGNITTKRDWGYAPEYVELIFSLMQQTSPQDIVIGTGESHTVKDFIDTALSYIDIEIQWENNDNNYKAIVLSSPFKNIKNNQVIISYDPKYNRPAEVYHLQADCTKANKIFGNRKIKFQDLVKIMIDKELHQFNIKTKNEGLTIIKDCFYWLK